MKKRIPYYFIMVFTVIMFTSTHNFALTQGPGPCMSPPCIPPPPPGLAPIDGGVVFLLISGLLLGINNLRKKEE